MAQSLGAIGDPDAIPALLEAIHHPRNLDLRVCATHALAQIDDASAVAPLIARAENVNLRQDDRVSAIRALGDLARPEARPVLRRIAADDPDARYRTIATVALRQIELLQASDPVPGLTAALNSTDLKICRSWFIQKLAAHWDSRSATALNQFVLRADTWRADRIQAAALLLHRGAVEAEATRALASAEVKEQRWLARYIQGRETDRPNVDAVAQANLINRLNRSPLSP